MSLSKKDVQERAGEHEPSSNSIMKRSTLRNFGIIATCTSAMIVTSANGTSVAIALPRIGQDFFVPQDQLQWIVSAYSLTSGCMLLLFGRLADLWGRKKAFIIGSLSVAAFTLGCGFAKDCLTLDILRAFQGVGSAATVPAAIGILAQSFPPSQLRSIAFASFAAGAPLGAGLGLALGGALTQDTAPGWRSTFYFSAALTLVCALCAVIFFDPDPPRSTSDAQDRRVDWLGALFVTTGLVLIVFVLSNGIVAGWNSPYIITLFIIGVILVVLFFFWQHYLERTHAQFGDQKSPWTPPPLLPVSIWKRARGRFAAVMFITFFNWMAFMNWNFWIQLYYQDYLALGPIKTMLRLLPMVVTGLCCNAIVAFIVGRIPVIWILSIGTGVTSLAPLLIAVINPAAPYWTFGFFAAIFSVFGADFVFSSGTLFVAKVVAEHEQSVAGGLFQTMTQLGTSLGLALTALLFDSVTIGAQGGGPNGGGGGGQPGMGGGGGGGPGPSPPSPAEELKGYRAAQWMAFGFGVLATVLSVISMYGVGIVGHRGPPAGHEEGSGDHNNDASATVNKLGEGGGAKDDVLGEKSEA